MIWAIGILGLVLVFVAGVAAWEKRMVWPYSSLTQFHQLSGPTAYTNRQITDAQRCGFRFLGWSRDIKGEHYEIGYAFLVSEDQSCLAIVSAGKLLNIDVQGTWLHTPSAETGRNFYSTDNQNCAELDLTGRWKNQLAPQNPFNSLWVKHGQWVQSLGVEPKFFPVGEEIETFHKVREERYHHLAGKGIIVFTDENKTHWRYTVMAALRWSVVSWAIGTLRALTFGRLPRTA